jgi:mannose-6-phosphate isomerase-like protein (cupin superfamily)
MTTTRHKRGISIFRAADAPDLVATDFMSAPTMSPDAREGLTRFSTAGGVEGGVVKVLARDAGGFSLVHVWFKANYPLPRHSHDADCMYYVISGSAVMGNQTLRPGDAFFVPADAPYQYNAGPEGVEVLEVRHGAERFDMKIPDATPERWQAMADAVSANRDGWAQTPVSPTFAANAG